MQFTKLLQIIVLSWTRVVYIRMSISFLINTDNSSGYISFSWFKSCWLLSYRPIIIWRLLSESGIGSIVPGGWGPVAFQKNILGLFLGTEICTMVPIEGGSIGLIVTKGRRRSMMRFEIDEALVFWEREELFGFRSVDTRIGYFKAVRDSYRHFILLYFCTLF